MSQKADYYIYRDSAKFVTVIPSDNKVTIVISAL